MGSDEAWRRRLLDGCERTLADLKARGDPATAMLISEVQALRDRLQRELDADRGPSRATRSGAAAPPREPSGK